MLTIDASTVNEIRDQLDSWRADLAEDGHFQVAEDVANLIAKLPDPDKDECPRQLPQFGGCTLTTRPYERVVLGNAEDPLGFVELRSIAGGTAKIRFWFPPKVRIFRGKVADRIIAEKVAGTGPTI